MKLLSLLFATVLAAGPSASGAPKLDSDALAGWRARAIGPAVFGGRVEAIDVSVRNPNVVFVGAAGGGVWRSTDGAVTFQPVFDRFTQSIGAVTIDQAHPETIWVGTGEGDTRNSVSIGSGLYRSDNGGDDWKLVGLADSERISRVVVDPADSNTIYAAVVGRLWSDGGERGLFKSSDGGATWENVLSANASTGCADIAIDPNDPKVLYAALWDFRRSPDFFRSGGPGSGLYKSKDAGASWRRLGAGLPSGEIGRIAIAVAPSRSRTLYATIESKKSGLYRSDDAGESWRLVNSASNVAIRPFYFSHLEVDPKNPERIYKPGLVLTVSEDGGKTFSVSGGGVNGGSYHPDVHALWIDPSNPGHLVAGTDGGIYASFDRGGRWQFLRSLPISQAYHVALDSESPYNVYGGFQDNGCWYGPSAGSPGIGNDAWRNYGFGDGFSTFPDPLDRDVVYWEYQGGELYKYFRSTKESKQIRPYGAAGEKPLRFNWDAPFVVSGADPHRLFAGAQYLFSSTDGGESWRRISGDLTTDDPALQRQLESGGLTPEASSAENHCTISAIAPSPLNARVVWVGTDDGNLQLTRDGGARWELVRGGVPGVPAGTGISGIEASRFDPAVAYATFDGHARGDIAPYVFRTSDFGKSWTALATPELSGYAHVIREDPKSPSLLYLGTEDGLFLTIDGGGSWARFTGGLPRVPVRDIAIPSGGSDLVLATHGRGFYVVDDVSPLRQLTAEVLASDVTVLSGRPAHLPIPGREQMYAGDAEFAGENRTSGAVIDFYRGKRRLVGDSRIEIVDSEGRTIATLPGSNRRGLNRVVWNARLKRPRSAEGAGIVVGAFQGPTAPAGSYTVKVIDDERVSLGRLVIEPDPRVPLSDEQLRHEALMRLFGMQEDLAFLTACVTAVDAEAGERAARISEPALGRELARLSADLRALGRRLVSQAPPMEGMALDADRQLREWITDLYAAVNGFGGRPSEGQLAHLRRLDAELRGARRDFDSIAARLPGLDRELSSRSLAPIELPTRTEWEKKTS